MKKTYSTHWKSSTQRRKQRKYQHNAPLHVRQNMMGCTLSDELRKKYGKRSTTIRKGDKVKIVRGSAKGKTTSVERVDLRMQRVFLKDIEKTRKEGSKSNVPIHPSNLIITELALDDKKRKAKLEAKKQGTAKDAAQKKDVKA